MLSLPGATSSACFRSGTIGSELDAKNNQFVHRHSDAGRRLIFHDLNEGIIGQTITAWHQARTSVGVYRQSGKCRYQ